MRFKLQEQSSKSAARAGELKTDHGIIPTPIFMPVGTLGSVKGVLQRDLEQDINAKIILGNTYHLYLRPGMELLKQAGGLHKFISWDRPILTDSGGYQVYSLADRRKISEEGVKFCSHIDGSWHYFSPESVMDVQRSIGADIMMAFDECTPYPCEYNYAKNSMEMTHRWLDRCLQQLSKTQSPYAYEQLFFPIVQGSTFPDLRKKSAEYIASKDTPGYAIGGLSVGEPHQDMYAMTDLVCSILPKDKPRYLMGVGTPSNLLECISLGIDMFDCVMPTRNARNGQLFTSEGIINIRNQKWQNDLSPIDPNGTAEVDKRFSKAYLRHLVMSKEMLGAQISSIHNLSFYLWLVTTARERILAGNFELWRDEILPKLSRKL